MKGRLAARLFKLLLTLHAVRRLGPASRDRTAYEAFFQSLTGSRVMRLLFSRADPGFACSFEEYAVYVASFVFHKQGIPKFYLPIDWEDEPIAAHLSAPAIFLSVHNGFAFTTKAITDHGHPLAVLAASPAAVPRRHERSGVVSPQLVTILRPGSNALLYLRKALDEGKHVSCFADRLDAGAGTYAIESGVFRLAAKTGRPLYFTRFTVNQRGRVAGMLVGPVDCRDPDRAMEYFKAFNSGD